MRDTKDVANPILRLTSAIKLQTLSHDVRMALRDLLMDLRRESAAKAQVEWRRNKGMTAAYWKAVSIYAGHIAKLLRGAKPTLGQMIAQRNERQREIAEAISKHGQIIDQWVIVLEPDRVPEKKIPMGRDDAALSKLLHELVECRSADTRLVIARLTWNNELWVDDGREQLQIEAAMRSAA